MQKMMSIDFLERIVQGQKEFKNILLEYADLSGQTFTNLHVSGSKILFTSLRNCTFDRVTFDQCELFFAACGFSQLRSTTFTNCTLEYSGFTGATFEDTTIRDSRVSFLSLIDTNIGGLRLVNCAEWKIVRRLEELTAAVIEAGVSHIEPLLQQLDFDTREKIRKLVHDFEKIYNVEVAGRAPAAPGRYASGPAAEPAAGYKMFDALVDSAILEYGGSNPYKAGRDKKKDLPYR